MAETARPDERALMDELASARFQLGEARGHWQLASVAWPYVTIRVAARDDRRYAFRFECSGYPSSLPEVTIWDTQNNAPLAPGKRPVMLAPYQLVFRTDWENGRFLYHPMARHAFATHNGWEQDLRLRLWHPSRGLTQWCDELHRILNSNAYQSGAADAA